MRRNSCERSLGPIKGSTRGPPGPKMTACLHFFTELPPLNLAIIANAVPGHNSIREHCSNDTTKICISYILCISNFLLMVPNI